MLSSIWQSAVALISAARCPLCGGEASTGTAGAAFCDDCLLELALPEGGLQGDTPLLWCALAAYRGGLRRVLLRQRPRPDAALLAALAVRWHGCCSAVLPGAVLVPIPSWKRQANPLPLLLAGALQHCAGPQTALLPQLLRRRRPTLGQHHLDRALRWRNQRDAFVAEAAPARIRHRPLWLVDDILTTGATAQAAAEALQRAGFAVQGLLVLARTPAAGPS